MHSFNSDFRTGAHIVTLRSWMIDLPKFDRWKIRCNSELSGSKPAPTMTPRPSPSASAERARVADAFVSEGVMQQNPRDRDTLDQLRDGPKPGLPNNFREQTCLG